MHFNFNEPSVIRSASNITDVILDAQDIYLLPRKVVICTEARNIIAKLPTDRSNAFMISSREFYLEAAKQVKKRSNLSCAVLSSLRLLQPEKGKGVAAHSVLMLAEHFPQVIPLEKQTLL